MIGDSEDVTKELSDELFAALYCYIDNGCSNDYKECSTGSNYRNVEITGLEKINSLNNRAWGIYSKNGVELFQFELRDGNYNGSEIISITNLETESRVIMNSLKVLWRWLDGRKSNWGSWCMFISLFLSEFVVGIWEYNPPWMANLIQSAGWFAMVVFGIGKAHKQAKNGSKPQIIKR